MAGLSLARGGSGDPSPSTALGVEAAIRVTLRACVRIAVARGPPFAVLGVGHVGAGSRGCCAEEGARLVLADVDPAKRALADELGAGWATPADALTRRGGPRRPVRARRRARR